MNESTHSGGAGGSRKGGGTFRVDLLQTTGRLAAARHDGREVHDGAHAVERGEKRSRFGQVPPHALDTRRERMPAGSAAQHPDGVTFGDELVYEVAAHEPGAAGQKDHDTVAVERSRASCGTTVAAPRRVWGMLSRSTAEPTVKRAHSAGAIRRSMAPLAKR